MKTQGRGTHSFALGGAALLRGYQNEESPLYPIVANAALRTRLLAAVLPPPNVLKLVNVAAAVGDDAHSPDHDVMNVLTKSWKVPVCSLLGS